jgi:ADP-ribose pyrophosphatase
MHVGISDHPSLMPPISTQRLYTGRILNLDLDTVRFPDGSTGTLEMIRHPGAAAVLPFLDDPAAHDDPRVVLIRQFRHAADGYIWEVPAGRLDPGEADAPERCAMRELTEETGYRAGRLERLTTIYTTPGFIDERIHLYTAHDLEPGDHEREHDEFVEVHELRWSEVRRMVAAGEIVDGKTLAAVMFAGWIGRAPDRA